MAPATPRAALDALRQPLEQAICGPHGQLAAGVRAAALREPLTLPAPLAAWAHQVAEDATQTTDAGLCALRAAGLDDRAIFELTAAAAVGQAGRLVEAALAALERPKEDGCACPESSAASTGVTAPCTP